MIHMTESTTTTDFLAVVTEATADALGLDESEVAPAASLLDDLGVESIDLLDILFRVERKAGVKVQASDLADRIQGGIPDEEFGDENEVVSAAGLAHLKTVMPQIDAGALAGVLTADQVMSLLTVENLAAIVTDKVAADAG
jgi:acyl carrier protein